MSEMKNEIKNDETIEQENEQIKENLTCSELKVNYLDDPNILLGYRVIQYKIPNKKHKIELYPIPELISYDGYISQLKKFENEEEQDNKLVYYYNKKFESDDNQFYNYWIPIYVDENHYENNNNEILNVLNAIKYGSHKSNKYGLNPDNIFELLPIIINRIILGIIKTKSENISKLFIKCLYHYILLMKKLCIEYENEYFSYVNYILSTIKKKDYNANRQIIRDINNFFILLFFSSKDTNTEKLKKIWNILFEEFAVRQMYWIFHEENSKYKIKKIIEKDSIDFKKCEKNSLLEKLGLNDIKYFTSFEKDPTFDLKDNKKFIEDLKNHNIYNTIVKLFLNDINFKTICDPNYMKEKGIKKLIGNSFKKLYCDCHENTKKEIKELITSTLNISDYFEKKFNIENFKKDIYSYTDKLYDEYNIDELLTLLKDDILEKVLNYAFESQRDNKILIFAFLIKKKIEDKDFMEELENNYGVYLDIDSFIQEMNQELNKVHNYHELFNYIGSDFGKDMKEIDILINTYQKAKEKNYIGESSDNHSESFSLSSISNISNEDYNKGRSGYSRGRRGYNRGRGGYNRGRRGYRGNRRY